MASIKVGLTTTVDGKLAFERVGEYATKRLAFLAAKRAAGRAPAFKAFADHAKFVGKNGTAWVCW